MANFLMEKYHYVMNDLADPRVKGWAGFSSPFTPIAIIATYLFLVYDVLPRFMENRKPFSLKTILYYYNIFQIVACAYLTYGMFTSGWTTTYSLGCQPVDYSNNPEAVRMLTFVYYTYNLKGIDLLETVMFVLRKKYNQVSKLHVYHHASSFLLAWIGVKFVAGGMATFPALINLPIHVLMYTYYLLSSLGPEWQKTMVKWKPKLTMLQMIQFCVLLAHASQALHPDCHVPKELLLIYAPNVLLIFYMFWQFYKKSYINDELKAN